MKMKNVPVVAEIWCPDLASNSRLTARLARLPAVPSEDGQTNKKKKSSSALILNQINDSEFGSFDSEGDLVNSA